MARRNAVATVGSRKTLRLNVIRSAFPPPGGPCSEPEAYDASTRHSAGYWMTVPRAGLCPAQGLTALAAPFSSTEVGKGGTVEPRRLPPGIGWTVVRASPRGLG